MTSNAWSHRRNTLTRPQVCQVPLPIIVLPILGTCSFSDSPQTIFEFDAALSDYNANFSDVGEFAVLTLTYIGSNPNFTIEATMINNTNAAARYDANDGPGDFSFTVESKDEHGHLCFATLHVTVEPFGGGPF